MEKTIYQTKNKKFEILFVSSFIFGFIKSNNLFYIAIGCFIFEFTLQKKKPNLKAVCATILLASILMASCTTRNGYGCKGNQSWERMVRRINSPR
jgi:hypothetical protein